MPRPGDARRAHPVQAHRRQGLCHRGPLRASRRAAVACGRNATPRTRSAAGTTASPTISATAGCVAIVTDPESPLIGTLALKSYPIDERKNVVFVFIGDETPHALALDLQPGFLDEDLAIYPNGEHEIVKSNWRLARRERGRCLAHLHSPQFRRCINAARKQLPLASYFMTREGMVIDKEGAPKGVLKGAGRRTSVWETEIEGVKVESQYRPGGEPSMRERDRHLAVAALRPQGRPFPDQRHASSSNGTCRSDEHSHHYIVTWGRRVKNEAQIEKFVREMDAVWKDMVVDKFNNEDVIAREAMERFYAEEDGWNREYLYRPDVVITEWRKLASKHNRGIQRQTGRAGQGRRLQPERTIDHDRKLEDCRSRARPARSSSAPISAGARPGAGRPRSSSSTWCAPSPAPSRRTCWRRSTSTRRAAALRRGRPCRACARCSTPRARRASR